MKNRIYTYIAIFTILFSGNISYGQEGLLVDLQPLTDIDGYGFSTTPVHEGISNGVFYHRNKKYKITLPDENASYGITFAYFKGIKGEIRPNDITILIKDFKTSDPTFYMDKNDNLDFTDDDPPKQFCDSLIRHHGQNYKYVPFSINNPNNSNKSYHFYLKERHDTTGLNFLKNTIKLSGKEKVADVEYWLSTIRFNRVRGELKLGIKTFEIIVEDYYCSTNYSSKGNVIYTHKLKEELSRNDKWHMQDETIIALGDHNYKVEVDPLGTKAVLTKITENTKLRYRKNDKIFDFSIVTLNGSKKNMRDYLHNDKQVLLYFWGTWCAPCKQLLPDLKEFYRNNHKQIEIVGMTNGKKEKVLEYIKKNEIEWVNSIPNKKDLGSIMTKLNVTGYPSFILVDKDGFIKSEDTSLYFIINMFSKTLLLPITRAYAHIALTDME